MNEVREYKAERAIKPETTSEERTWAALAHLSAILTVFVAFGSAGIGGVFFVFVPLVIYLMYKDKSQFVAYHAAQAFALQVVASVGFFVAILAAAVIIALAWVVTGLLSIILIGLILIPVALLLTVALALALVAIPFVFGGFSIAAGIQTASGEDYEYPYLGRWVADWLARHEAEPAPMV
jgi:uncharacterized Tic20 family protein